ncbi:DNA-dependent protein kinase catalytic subunit isoform X1 [Hydra vulgaris]|uniref:DNA-dependent protein kinase catalytic subunit isoform X1 n=2 Tax=Hydra vulgaris TaxID=6087 RepID=UPI0032EA76EE
MSGELTRLLETIFLLRTKNSDSIEVSSTLNNIFSLALNIADNEIGYFSETLFNENNGILKFLKLSIGSNELENAKGDILRFLSEFCTKKLVKFYIKGIKETCLALFFCDTSVKVKIEVIHVIEKIMLLPDINQFAVDLDIKSLISKFWSECLKSAKYSSTMRGELYNLMGSFAKVVPELMTEINERLLSLFLSFLKQEMESTKKKKPELLVIAGCLNGLSGYLVHFTQSCAESSKYASIIMKYVKMCILLTDYSRYDVPKAALTLLALHSSQFNELLTLQAEQIYDALELWINHQNKEVKKIAITATESFLYEVSCYISSVKNDQTTKILKVFLFRFHKTLNSPTASYKEISMAIKGYGKFSLAFSNVMTENEKISVFDEILKRSEMILLNNELFHQLPTYLESLSCILKIFTSVNYSLLQPIEKIIIFIFENIFNLGKTGLALYMKGIATFIDSVSSTQSMLKTSLSRIVYQILIRTCSHSTLSEEISTENLSKKDALITIKTFLPIWNFLLEEKNYSISVYSRSELCVALKELLYDCILSAFLNVLNKLNFVTENKEAEKLRDPVSDPTLNLVPKMPQDFIILVNLVDLFGELLCKKSLDSFSRWVYIFVEETLKFSMKLPFVSGFYKLLRHSLWISEQIGYFEANNHSDEKARLFKMLSAFVKEVSARVKQFKEDLLVSAVMFLLSLPVSVIKESKKFIIPIFQVALQLGLSYYEIAELCLDTLDRLQKKLNESDMESIVRLVLPHFNDYIQPIFKEEDSYTEHVTLTKSERKVKRVPIRYLRALAMSQKDLSESPLFNLELRVIKFLGCLGGRLSIGILQNAAKFSKHIVWDTNQHLPFALPFRDMKPTIYLDMFIPRVVELALYSSNRQIKVVSSELLHGLVIFMLGIESQQQGKRTSQKLSMERLYKEIFPALIKLSCSQEQVSEQLFSPLLFQIIHWFTGRSKYESPETIVLLDAILDGVSDPDNSAVRDFSAKCVKEFLTWSIKQTTEKQMESNPGNPRRLFKQMISLACHPNPYKRISAAIVFNNCYTVFREEEILVNTFILELLLVYINGLSLSHKDEKSFGSIDQYELSLQHMEKIIKKKCDILLKPFKNRRHPIQFKDTTDFNLRHVSMWLLSECGSPQTACRHQCMKLFISFMLLQEGVEEYMKNAIADRDGDDLFRYFEGGGISRKGIHHYPTLPEKLKAEFSFSRVINWLENLLGALDCYSWIISARYLPAQKIFKGNSTSKLFTAIVYFIDEISLVNCKNMLMKFMQDILPSECDTYDRLKCTIIVRIIYIISLTLEDELWKANTMKDIGDKMFSNNFLKVIVYCMVYPQCLGFQVSDLEVLEKLPEEMYTLSEKMRKFAPDHFLNSFYNVLSSVLCEKQYNLLSHLPLDICNTNNDICDMLCQLASGYKLLHKCELFAHLLSVDVTDLKKKLLESLLDSLSNKEKVSFLLPAQMLLANSLFRLYLEINPSAALTDLFVNEKFSQNTKSRGLVLYDLLRSVIINYYIDYPLSLQKGFDNSETLSYVHLIILQDILAEYVSQKKSSVKNVQQFTFQFLKYPEKLATGIRFEKTQIQVLDIFILILNVFEGTLKDLPFLNALIEVLFDSKNSLAVKEKVISCSPHIFKKGSSQQCADFKVALEHVVANDFPVNSDELQIRSLKYAEYTSCLSQFLRVLVNSSSPLLFEVLVSVFVREVKSVYEKVILPALQMFAKNLKENDVDIVLDLSVKMFNDESKYADDIRAVIIDRVCIPLLNEVSWISLKQFFQRNILVFTSHIDEKFNKLLQSKLASQLINKICSFNVLSLMYELLGKEELTSATSTIVQTFCPNSSTGKELTVFLSKSASQSYKESYNENNMELQRKYHCSAYNCLISIISCTQNEMKFFAGLLFAENLLKGSFVLENLVDLKKEYNFKSNVSFEKMKVMPLIRKASCELGHQPNQREENEYILSNNPSRFLMESSLSQEVMEFSINKPFKPYTNNEEKSLSNEEESVESFLELDELNQHECMSKYISLINHMRNKNIYIQPNDKEVKDMPPWMTYFHGKITNKDTEFNVVLYIARIVINEPKLFQPYAQFWFLPIIELLLSQRILGDYLNYFVVGLIETMLSWSPNIPENTASGSILASSLLDYLVKNCHNLDSPVLQTNLYLINALSSSWRDRVTCPYKLIYSLFSFSDQNSKKNLRGLQILQFYLANGFAPFATQISGLTEYDYFLALSNNLLFTYKEVYATCAEVCGISLKYYFSKCESPKVLLEMVQGSLCELSKNNKEKFIVCLHSIQINYPMVVDRFISQLLYCTSNMFGTLKTMCIQCLASRTEQLVNEQQTIFSQVKGKEIDYILNTNDEETQIGGLALIDGLLKGLSLEQLLPILKKIEPLQKSIFVKVREIVYKIFMKCFDHFKEKREEETSKLILQICKETLLVGIADKNTDLNLVLLNFWRKELSENTIERFTEILTTFYSSKTEKEYISYSTNLILQLTSLSPDYSLPLFSMGLDEEKTYSSFDVKFSWQHQKASLTPLFVSSQHSNTSGTYSKTQGNEEVVPTKLNQVVRATQKKLDFSQTHQIESSIDWMSPTIQITPQEMLPGLNIQTNSKNRKNKNEFSKPSSKDFRFRHFKNKSEESYYFASLEKKRQKLRESALEKRKIARDQKVVMYRKYRIGELPDIMIKHSDLIVPLQALAQLDHKIGQQLFVSIFLAILNQLSQSSESILLKIQNTLNIIMQSSIFYDSTFINAVETVCLKNKEMNLEPQVVSSASIISLQQPIGILLIEKQLISLKNNIEEPKSKRLRADSQQENYMVWSELAKIYTSIKDFDFVQSIFCSQISTNDVVKRALAAEATNDYSTALHIYRKASQKENWEITPSYEEEEYWDTARLRCYENLGMWTNLKDFTLKSIEQINDSDDFDCKKMWENDILQEIYLPCYIRSNIKLMVEEKYDLVHKEFQSFIDSSLSDEYSKCQLQMRFCEDLALLKILQDNYGAAHHFLKIAETSFLDEWSLTSQFINDDCMIKLNKLQRVEEMISFVSLMTSDNYKDTAKVQEFFSYWSNRLPDPKKHSTIAWNDIVLSRCAFIKKFKSVYLSDRVMLDYLEGEEKKNILKLVDVATKQGNFAVAKQYLRDSHDVILKEVNNVSAVGLHWRHLYAKVYCKTAKKFQNDIGANFTALVSVIGHLEKCQSFDKTIATNLLEFDGWRCLLLCNSRLQNDEFKLITCEIKKLATLSQFEGDKLEFEKTIKEKAWTALSLAYEKSVTCKISTDLDSKLHHKAYMEMFLYCDELIENEENSEMKCCYAKTMVDSLLKAMAMNSSKARIAFPRLLQVVNLFPSTGELFEKQSSQVPCWMFLGWINQIVSMIDMPIVVHLKPIIDGIVKSYKQALSYPLKVSSKQFTFSTVDSQNKEYLKWLLRCINIPVIDEFARALYQLSDPVSLVKDFLEQIKGYVSNGSKDEIRKCYKSINDLLLSANSRQSSESILKGRVFIEFAKKFSSYVESLFGKDGEKVLKMSLNEFQEATQQINEKLKEYKSINASLSDYSPWLSSFQPDSFLDRLEIPGQYTGESKPIVEYHVKINGFDEKVLVMNSLRKPKKITIRGDDEKDYYFLVKEGEDLRQDQRVQQVFVLMNKILQNDSVCCNRLLKLKTYQVVPITSRLGMIEWVSNTIPYFDFLYNDDEKKVLHGPSGPIKKYKQFYGKFENVSNVYKSANRSETVKVFEDCVSTVPWDSLRRAFEKLALSSEAYFVLRKNFIQSHSCLCIAHYILGIGDRHLNNMLIDNKTGGVVGIDFGYAFGIATQLLKYPELVPFRLTQQMLNLLLPLKDVSPYKQSMIVVLQALQQHSKMLISTMDIFINEPLIDWQNNAKKYESLALLKESSPDWYPKQKINICKQKLNGVNPAFITSEELRNSFLHTRDQLLLESYISIVEGSSQHNIRKKLLDRTNNPEKEFLTVEEQIDCLVDQATDPNLLGRAWIGWFPWI